MNYNGIDQISFLSKETFLDADILMLDFDGITQELSQLFTYINTGKSYLTQTKHKVITESVEHRRKEIKEFLEMDRTLIIKISAKTTFQFSLKEEFDFSDHELELFILVSDYLKKPKFAPMAGINISVSSNKLLSKFTHNGILIWKYDMKFDDKDGVPLLHINKTTHVISKFFPLTRGNIIYLPPFLHDILLPIKFLQTRFLTLSAP